MEFFVAALAGFAAAAGGGFEEFPHFDGVDEGDGYEIFGWIGFAGSKEELKVAGCRCRPAQMMLNG